MSAVRMLASVSWNRQRPLYMSARWVGPGDCSGSCGDTDGKVWKCNGMPTSLMAAHSGSHCGCHMGSMSQEHDSSMPLKPILATRCTSATAAAMAPYGRFAGPMWRLGYWRQKSAIHVL